MPGCRAREAYGLMKVMPPQQMPPQQPESPLHDYEFIVNPSTAPRRSLFSLPGQSSTPLRLLTVLGGIFVLVIILVIIKNIIGGGPDLSAFVPVVQDQQELIHLSTNAALQPGLTTADQDFAITAELTLTSSQTQLLTYLKNNHSNVNTKTLGLKVSTSLDAQLTTAATDSTYDSTLQQIMQSQLTGYQQDIKQAYTTAGSNGRRLLNSDFQQAQLLVKQLTVPTN